MTRRIGMFRTSTRLLAAVAAAILATGFVGGGRAAAATASLSASDSGWYRFDGVHSASITNYLVSGAVHDWFLFDVSSLDPNVPVVNATLSLANPSGYPPGGDLTLHDVVTPVPELTANHEEVPAPEIFTDLGDGIVFGSVAVPDVTASPIAVPLNAAGVAALNSSIAGGEKTFATGGTFSGGYLFGFSGWPTQQPFAPVLIVEFRYPFIGFLSPVDNEPIVNEVTAGAAIPVKFSLGADRGLDIFAVGYPASKVIACDTGAPTDLVEVRVKSGGSSLMYDARTNTYTYVWRTNRTWAGTCRQLQLLLDDGTLHTADFQFR
jgi:hypothetical protein